MLSEVWGALRSVGCSVLCPTLVSGSAGKGDRGSKRPFAGCFLTCLTLHTAYRRYFSSEPGRQGAWAEAAAAQRGSVTCPRSHSWRPARQHCPIASLSK